MNASPKVSIGLPIYNGERYLAEAIESVLAQTFTDFELVICDNASADGTRDICESYAARDSRIRYFRNHVNIGGFPNHNRVFAMCSGEYFGWTSDDDVRAPRHVEACVEGLDSDPGVTLCYTLSGRIDENGDALPTDEPRLRIESLDPVERFADLSCRSYSLEPIYGLMRTSVLRETQLEPPYADSDRVLLADLGLRGRFLRIDEELFYRREHPMRSVNVYPSRAERTAWFDPAHSDKFVWPFHRQMLEYAKVIVRAPVSWRDKLRCLGVMAGWVRENAQALGNDHRVVLTRLFGPTWHRLKGS